MKSLPKDRDLLLRLFDKINAITSGLANDMLNIETEMKHETSNRDIYRKMPLREQFHQIARSGVGSTQFRDRLLRLDEVAVAHLSSLGEYLPEEEVTLLLDENDRCRSECGLDWDSAAGILPDLLKGDDNKRLHSLFAARDLLIRIVRVRMRVFKDLAVMITRLRQRVEDTIATPVDSGGESANKNKQKPRKRVMSKDEANLRVDEYLKKWFKDNPDTKKMPPQRKISKAIGCSHGMITNLPAYEAVKEKFKCQKAKSSPKAVGLSDYVLDSAGEGKRDDMIDGMINKEEEQKKQEQEQLIHSLIEESKREAKRDPSPLEDDQPDRPLIAREYKKV